MLADYDEINRRNALFIRIREELLDGLERGDELLYSEIRKIIGGEDITPYASRIRRWAHARGLALESLPTVGWRIATAEGQIGVARSYQKRKLRASRRAIFNLQHAGDPGTLSKGDEERRMALLRKEAASYAQAQDEERAAKKLESNVKTDPRPRLKDKN